MAVLNLWATVDAAASIAHGPYELVGTHAAGGAVRSESPAGDGLRCALGG